MFDLDNPDYAAIKSYLIQNYRIIRMRPYNGEQLTDLQAAIIVFRYLAKTDHNIATKIAASGIQDEWEALYRMLSGDTTVCSKGKMGFNRFKMKLTFCDRACPCAISYRSKVRRNFSPERKAETNNKRKATMLERHGVEHNMYDTQSKQKMMQTNMERYGHHCSLHGDSIKKKTKQTLLERYGVDEPLKSTEIYCRGKVTRKELYGDENFPKTESWYEKTKQTSQDRYGTDHWFKLDRLKSSPRRQRAKPDVWPNTNKLSKETQAILLSENKFRELMEGCSRNRAAIILGVDKKTISNYCNLYGIKLERSRSTYEIELAKQLTDLGVQFEANNRKIISPQEIDILIPDHRLAIEINGLYWHSLVGPKYHREKYLRCRELGYTLLTINEDEWLMRPQAVMSLVRHRLGLSEKGSPARKTKVEIIKTPNDFYNKHHIIGGGVTAKLSLGAFYNDELIAAMSFAPQRGKSNIMELVRYCSDDKSHAGIFSKLLSNARKYIDEDIITFADLRYSEGAVYKRNGFELVGDIRPDYRYTKGLSTFHKSNFTKKKIEAKFGIDMSNKTESDAMKELGFRRIYDCGKKKFILKAN